MGTEIFPTIFLLFKIIVWFVVGFSFLIILVSALEYKYGHDGTDKEHQARMKEHIVRSLIAIVIILIVYFLISAVGPAFQFLFQ